MAMLIDSPWMLITNNSFQVFKGNGTAPSSQINIDPKKGDKLNAE